MIGKLKKTTFFKRTTAFACAALICLSAAVPAFAGSWKTCTGNGVNMRSGPSTSYTSYGQLNKGDRFYASSGSSWKYGFPSASTALYKAYGYYVYGYVSNTYLS